MVPEWPEAVTRDGAAFPAYQATPQYAEVPLNIEAKRIISAFPVVLSGSSNALLLKEECKIMIFFGSWRTVCYLL